MHKTGRCMQLTGCIWEGGRTALNLLRWGGKAPCPLVLLTGYHIAKVRAVVYGEERSIVFWPRERGSFADRFKRNHTNLTYGSFYRRAKGPPEINFPDSLESHHAITDLHNSTSISVSRELLGQASPSLDPEHRRIQA